MHSHKIKPSLTLFSNQRPVSSNRKSMALGRIYGWRFDVINNSKPLVIEDQRGNVFECGGFTALQRKQLKALSSELLEHPIAFYYDDRDIDGVPVNPSFIRLVPNIKDWSEQQLRRTTYVEIEGVV